MVYTVSDAFSELSGLLHGTSTNAIENPNGVAFRAARRLLGDLDPVETIRVSQLASINQDSYEYACPADLKDDRIIDIRRQANRLALDNFHQTYARDFDVEKEVSVLKNNYNILWRNGFKTLQLDTRMLTAPVDIEGITDSSIYSAVAGVSSLFTNTADYIYSSSSVTVVQSATTSTIETTLTDAVDISDQSNTGRVFLGVWFSDGSVVSSVDVQLGTDSTNYRALSATTTNDGLAFQTGWNLVGFDLSSGTDTGSYTGSIEYVSLSVTTTSNITVKYNYLRSGIGEMFGILYYSKYLFRDATTNAFMEKPTSSNLTEIINLDTTSYNMYVFALAAEAAQQVIPLNSEMDRDYYDNRYKSELERYIAKIKSQTQPATITYYRTPPGNIYPGSTIRLR